MSIPRPTLTVALFTDCGLRPIPSPVSMSFLYVRTVTTCFISAWTVVLRSFWKPSTDLRTSFGTHPVTLRATLPLVLSLTLVSLRLLSIPLATHDILLPPRYRLGNVGKSSRMLPVTLARCKGTLPPHVGALLPVGVLNLKLKWSNNASR